MPRYPSIVLKWTMELFYFILSGHHSEHNNFFHGSSITTEGENISKSCSLREVRAVMDIEADFVPARGQRQKEDTDFLNNSPTYNRIHKGALVL